MKLFKNVLKETRTYIQVSEDDCFESDGVSWREIQTGTKKYKHFHIFVSHTKSKTIQQNHQTT